MEIIIMILNEIVWYFFAGLIIINIILLYSLPFIIVFYIVYKTVFFIKNNYHRR